MVVYKYRYIVYILIFAIIFVWLILLKLPDNNLHIIACDVGQGDGILIVYKNFQIITDGGPPNGKMEKCLSKHLPFWDREIEVVVNTHPQLDHFGGLIKIFQNYKVDNFLSNDQVVVGTQELEVLRKVVGSNGTSIKKPSSGVNIVYGLMSYDIFYPTQKILDEVSKDLKRDSNDISIQSFVKMGEFEAILTGDIGENMSNEVLTQFTDKIDNHPIDYIKISHHGSKNGMTESYLRRFTPRVAVISVGKNNSYGHPSSEVIKILSDKDIKTYRTDKDGDVEVVTDGDKIWVKN